MPSRQTNPDQYGRYRVRDKTNKRSGTWSTTVFNPDTMLMVANADASDTYGKALPAKPMGPGATGRAPSDPGSAGNTNDNEGDRNDG